MYVKRLHSVDSTETRVKREKINLYKGLEAIHSTFTGVVRTHGTRSFGH